MRQLAAEIAKPFGELALLGVDGVELGGQLLFPVEQPLSVADRTDLTGCNLGHRLLHEAATTVRAGKSDGIMMHEGYDALPGTRLPVNHSFLPPAESNGGSGALGGVVVRP